MSFRTTCALTALLGLGAGLAAAQQDTPPDSGSVIRTETRLVLVDAVVTDKKGSYVRDLTLKDFKVWDDNKEQAVKNFSFEADPASPSNGQSRYLVLFFDNSTLDFGDQAQARKAASQFIEANAGPNRMMAVVNYGGAIQLAQNFTADAARLKAAVIRRLDSLDQCQRGRGWLVTWPVPGRGKFRSPRCHPGAAQYGQEPQRCAGPQESDPADGRVPAQRSGPD